jgi:cytochrome P450
MSNFGHGWRIKPARKERKALRLGAGSCPHLTSRPSNALPIRDELRAHTARAPWRHLLTGRIDFISLLPGEVFAQEFYEIRVLWQRYLLVNNPDAVRHVLVTHADRYVRTPMIRRSFKRVLGDSLITTEGETWRRHRHIMAPAFTPRSIRRHAPLISQAIAALIERWSELRDGTVIDLVATLRHLTIELISRAMFSADCRSEVATVNASVPHYVRGMRPGILDLLADGVASLPVGCPRRMRFPGSTYWSASWRRDGPPPDQAARTTSLASSWRR